MTDTPASIEGIPKNVYKKRWVILSTLCFALLGVMLANSSINIAMPLLAVDLGIDQLTMTWIVNIYTLLFASLLFLSGAIGDRYGRKRALQIGSAIFAISAAYAGFFAQTGTELIIARAIMGLGGALVMPTTLSIVDNVFPKNQRARAIAIWSGISGVGMMLGNVASGLLLEHFTWHSVFFLSAIIAGLGFVINHIVVPESRDKKEHAVDWTGGLLSALGIFGIVYGITEAPSVGLNDTAVLTGLLGGGVALATFIWWELRTKSPLLDMRLFKNKAFAVSSLTLTLIFLAMMGVLFSLSQVQQLILGMSPFEASISMVPMIIPMLVIAPFVPSIVKKFGARLTVTAGLVVISFAFFTMSLWDTNMTYVNMISGMMIMMGGIALAMTPGTNILMASVPKDRAGMGSAMNDTTRELGGALGIATLGATLSAVYTANVADISQSFGEPLRSAIEGSLATALNALHHIGEKGAHLIEPTKVAWMDALSTAALLSACIVFAAAIVAFIALPRHTKANSDTI